MFAATLETRFRSWCRLSRVNALKMHPRWSNLASFFTPDGFFFDTRLISMRTIIEFTVIGFENVTLVHTFYFFFFFNNLYKYEMELN